MSKNRRANNEGHFIFLEDGRFRLKWMSGFNANGNPRILTVTGRSKSECIKLKKEKEKNSPSVTLDGNDLARGTVLALCQQHLEHDIHQKHKLKPTAADRRETTIKNQIAPFRIAQNQVGSVTHKDVLQYVEALFLEQNLSVSSYKKAFHCLDGAFKWALLNNAITKNPCDRVREEILIRIKKLSAREANDAVVIVLTEEEEKQLRDEALRRDANGRLVHRVGPAVLLLLFTGIRVGELCALRWSDYKNGRLHIEKTRHYQVDRSSITRRSVVGEGTIKNEHARYIGLNKEAKEILDLIRRESVGTSEDAYIYLNRRKNPSEPTNIGYLINKLYRSAGLPKDISGAHVLRHTFATRLFNSGIQIKKVAAYIGDVEATVSSHYIATRNQIRENGETIHYEPFPLPEQNESN